MRTLRTRSRRRRQRRERQRWLAAALTFLGLALLAGGFYWWSTAGDAQATLEYRPEDVVYDAPLHAVHEMAPSSLASIPFLPSGSPQPKIAVSEAFHNFGSVGPTEVVTHEFAIANQGEAPMTISRAYTTCGCTTADFTATVIPPGKVSIMTLTLDAGFHDVRGQTVRRGVIIENNDPNSPQMEIWTQANVRAN
jgi:hypothetical protein